LARKEKIVALRSLELKDMKRAKQFSWLSQPQRRTTGDAKERGTKRDPEVGKAGKKREGLVSQ